MSEETLWLPPEAGEDATQSLQRRHVVVPEGYVLRCKQPKYPLVNSPDPVLEVVFPDGSVHSIDDVYFEA